MFLGIFVRTRAVEADRSVIVQDLVLDGVSVGDDSRAPEKYLAFWGAAMLG